MKTTIGEYVHYLRIKNGMTLTQLGAILGIDSGALSKIENGKKTFDSRNIPKIAEVFLLDKKELNDHFVSEKVASQILNHSCDESLLSLVEEKIKQFKAKNIKQAELKFSHL